MKALDKLVIFLRPRDYVESITRSVNYGGADNPNVSPEIEVGTAVLPYVGVFDWPRSASCTCEIDVPDGRLRGRVVCIEGIDTVVDRGDVDHVVLAVVDRNPADDEWLRVHLIVHGHREHLTELLNADVARGQHRLVVVPPGARVVIVLRQHGHALGIRRSGCAAARDAAIIAGHDQE